MIDKIDIPLFKKILELDENEFSEFLNFFSEMDLLKNDSTYADRFLFQYLILKDFLENNYSFNNKDDEINDKIDNWPNIKLRKLNSYICFLHRNKIINMREQIDILNYYGDIDKISPGICPYENISNVKYVGLENIINYLIRINERHEDDSIALSIVLERISLEEAEEYYDNLIKRYKDFCIKYASIIKKIVDIGLQEQIFEYISPYGKIEREYMYTKMIKYLTDNMNKKDKIYEVLKRIEELGLDSVKISLEPPESSEIYDVKVCDFEKAYYNSNSKNETILDGYAGTYIYTDADKNWLLKMKDSCEDTEYYDIYKVEISTPKFLLLNHKLVDWGLDCCGPFFGPFLESTSWMVIYDFDFDIDLLPSYEELHSFKIEPQVDFDLITKRTNAITSINKIDKAIDDVKGLIKKLQNLGTIAGNVKGTKEYNDVVSEIDNLEVFVEYLDKLKDVTSKEYSNEGILELKSIKTLQNIKKKK